MATEFESIRLKFSLLTIAVLFVILSVWGKRTENILSIKDQVPLNIGMLVLYLIASLFILREKGDFINFIIGSFIVLSLFSLAIYGLALAGRFLSNTNVECTNCLSYYVFGIIAMTAVVVNIFRMFATSQHGEKHLRGKYYRMLILISIFFFTVFLTTYASFRTVEQYVFIGFKWLFGVISLLSFYFYSQNNSDKIYVKVGTTFLSIVALVLFMTSTIWYHNRNFLVPEFFTYDLYISIITFLVIFATVIHRMVNKQFTYLGGDMRDMKMKNFIIFLLMVSAIAFFLKLLLQQIFHNQIAAYNNDSLNNESRTWYTVDISLDIVVTIMTFILTMFLLIFTKYESGSDKNTFLYIYIGMIIFFLIFKFFVAINKELASNENDLTYINSIMSGSMLVLAITSCTVAFFAKVWTVKNRINLFHTILSLSLCFIIVWLGFISNRAGRPEMWVGISLLILFFIVLYAYNYIKYKNMNMFKSRREDNYFIS